MQVINNAVHLLLQASIVPLKEFNNWEAVTHKTYLALKRRHIQEAFWCSNCVTLQGNRGRCLPPITCTTCSPTKSQQRHIAVLTTGSTITAIILELVANAINQLSANQTAFMNQMAAMSYATYPPPPPNKQYQPPIQQLTIPAQ
jgi:hypothetical protein